MLKPFKPPLLKSVTKPPTIDLTDSKDDSDDEHQYRPAKKRRLIHVVEESPPKPKAIASSAVNAPRKPLLLVKNPTNIRQPADSEVESGSIEGYYIALWYVWVIVTY
jgi:DNA repair and recombination protein RAD54B